MRSLSPAHFDHQNSGDGPLHWQLGCSAVGLANHAHISEQTRRPEDAGGGLDGREIDYVIRSAGGIDALKQLSGKEKCASDERIPGGGGFVESVLKHTEEYFGIQIMPANVRREKFALAVEQMSPEGFPPYSCPEGFPPYS